MILPYDARKPIADLKLKHDFDMFCVNPPYGSSTRGYGVKLWISRGLETLKHGGEGLIILPIQYNLKWSIGNLLEIQRFLTINNTIITDIDRDVHIYHDVRDHGLRSSNLWVYSTGKARHLIKQSRKMIYP